MNDNLIFNNQENKPITPDETLKATSLFYLKDALVNQRYEECPELVAAAQDFGASKREIRKVIVAHVRGVNGVGPAIRRKQVKAGGQPRF